MRGHGSSDPIAGDYRMEDLASDVATVMDALGVASGLYMGLSIGGIIGQAFAVHHGAKVKSMMLCDTRRRGWNGDFGLGQWGSLLARLPGEFSPLPANLFQ